VILQVATTSASSSVAVVSPQEILPFPKAGPRKNTRGRQQQKTRILTDTPVRLEVGLRAQQKGKNPRNETKRKLPTKNLPRKKKKIARKRLFEEEDSDANDDSVNVNELCDDSESDGEPIDRACPTRKGPVRRELPEGNASSHDNCVICGDIGRKKEWWYQCTMCSFWAHAACSGADTAVDYVCDHCQ